jgi:hypothetical protein
MGMSGVIGIVVALVVGYILFKLALKLIGIAIAVALGIGAYVLARRYLEKRQ